MNTFVGIDRYILGLDVRDGLDEAGDTVRKNLGRKSRVLSSL